MTNIEKIAAKTLEVLKDKKVQPTPNEYNKEFCNVAKSQNEKIDDCNLFKELVSKLTPPEQDELKANNVETFEELIGLLLKRVHIQNVSTLASIIKQALSPSINIHLDEQLTNFSIKIGDSPELIFEEDIQKEMQKLLENRFATDQNLLKEKTADIAKLVTLMGKHLKEAINNNQNSSTNVTNIKDELESIDLKESSASELVALQNKLINAATNIESEMNEVNKKLSTGEDHVKVLENKVQVLESQLIEAKKEAVIDHLTGLLTRRAYDTEIKMIDKNFERENIQYAIVFFDLDHFKNINDTYGHDGGDTVLKTFSKILKSQTRENDILARYGGEEFVATVEYKLRREVLQYLKRIKAIVNENSFNYKNKKIKVTFSAGVVLRNDHKTYESALQKADILLYEAKNGGRNKIILEDQTVI
ncbi:GGDEF domain-containing protein [uncultured Arcobacter sp.]|uniref:GGDEF domain-containing protein n=1 Tax=uncultured Arcobacter sp. TaxID=165434 RepID=UPI00260EE3D4|nr:GGDEF domain-containing protein [uncultured Arcobacter sp.]